MHSLERFFLNMMLISLIASPIVALIANWWRMGGRILLRRDQETGRIRGIQFIPSASLIRWFINDARSEKPCTKRLSRDQVMSLPEVEYDPCIHGHFSAANEEERKNEQRNEMNTTHADEKQQAEKSTQDSILPMGTGCSVCLEDFETGEKIRMLPCSHLYHLECILPWLTERQGVCPMCKQHVLSKYRRTASTQSSDETLVEQSDVSSSAADTPSDGVTIDVENVGVREDRREGTDLEIGNREVEISGNEQVSPVSSFDHDEGNEFQNSLYKSIDEENSCGENVLVQNGNETGLMQEHSRSLEKDDTNRKCGGREICIRPTDDQETREDEHISLRNIDRDRDNEERDQPDSYNNREREIFRCSADETSNTCVPLQ